MENLSTTRKPRILRDLLVVALLVMPFTAAYLHAQERPIQIQVTAGDTSTATALASGMRYHLSPASTNNNRYTLGTAFSVTTAIFPGTSGVPTLSENDILGIVHNVALTGGAGLGHVYHVFLPQGVDTCFDEGLCYSPDNFATFGMC